MSDKPDFAALRAERDAAVARGITVNELARRIVEVAVDESLVDSILDDLHDEEGSEHG